MESASAPGLIAAPELSQSPTVEVRARIPSLLRNQLELMAGRNFRSMAGEVAAACTAWVQQQGQRSMALPLLITGAALLAAAPAMAQCTGSPYSQSGCVLPRGDGRRPQTIYSDPTRPGQFRIDPAPVTRPQPFQPPGLNRDMTRPPLFN